MLELTDIPCVPSDPHAPAGLSPTDYDAAILDSYELSEHTICQLARALPIATLAEAPRCRERGVWVDYHLDRLGDEPSSRLLPGPAYAPLDPRFVAARRRRPTVDRALVTIGGGTAGHDIVGPAIAALRAVFPNAAVICASPGLPNGHQLTRVSRSQRLWDVLEHVDLAVSSAGLTAYELACAGVPAVLVPVVDNQRRVAAACVASGTALAVDSHGAELRTQLHTTLETLRLASAREAMAQRGMRLFDGDGARRTAQALLRRWKH